MNVTIKAQLTSEEVTTVLDLIESEIRGTDKRLELYKKQCDSKYAVLASKKLSKLKVIKDKLRGEKLEK